MRGTGWTGYALARALAERGNVVEMATQDLLLLLVSPSVSEMQVDTTIADLLDILHDDVPPHPDPALLVPPPLPEQVLTPRQATLSRARIRVPRREAVGRVSAETIGAYPPGQAIFVPGERIHAEGVEFLEGVVASGGHLKRVHDDDFQTIEVLA